MAPAEGLPWPLGVLPLQSPPTPTFLCPYGLVHALGGPWEVPVVTVKTPPRSQPRIGDRVDRGVSTDLRTQTCRPVCWPRARLRQPAGRGDRPPQQDSRGETQPSSHPLTLRTELVKDKDRHTDSFAETWGGLQRADGDPAPSVLERTGGRVPRPPTLRNGTPGAKPGASLTRHGTGLEPAPSFQETWATRQSGKSQRVKAKAVLPWKPARGASFWGRRTVTSVPKHHGSGPSALSLSRPLLLAGQWWPLGRLSSRCSGHGRAGAPWCPQAGMGWPHER